MSWAEFRENYNPPKSIGNCPIIEAIVDLRFNSQFPSEAIFGVIYNAIHQYFDRDVQKLSVSELPESIRSQDPGLQFQPLYRLRKANLLCQVGPRVISFICLREYSGWAVFIEHIRESLAAITQTQIIDTYLRVGVRYVNVFRDNIWDISRLNLNVNEEPLQFNSSNFDARIKTGEFLTNIRVSDGAEVTQDGERFVGSVLDIDTHLSGSWQSNFDITTIIESGHLEEKKTFFALLTEDYITKLSPSYE